MMPALGLGVREVLYRVVQEALSNAVRHGALERHRAGRRRGCWGSGRPPGDRTMEAAAHRSGGRPRFGLTGMRERIAALGGELVIDQGSGQGWIW